jgi:2,3-bisphosphoglycerate-dependent phosphoglycerate mutase 1
MPYWECEIFPSLMACDQVIVVAHGNSLRGIVKHLKQISDTDISLLNIPTATPYVFEFDNSLQLLRDYYLGDQEEIQRKQQAVANQGKRL